MKVFLAQVQSEIGHLSRNISHHLEFTQEAVAQQSDLILFPELSLTGYAPSIAKKMAFAYNDARLDVFQEVSNRDQISIALGAPVRHKKGISIGMFIFQPFGERQVYSKQILHSDETPFFRAGDQHFLFRMHDHRLAPAICYESLQKEHAERSKALGATMYLASVAKSHEGISKAHSHYANVSEHLELPVLMANAVGTCEGFISAGQSGIWDHHGHCIQLLDSDKEGGLLVDTNDFSL